MPIPLCLAKDYIQDIRGIRATKLAARLDQANPYGGELSGKAKENRQVYLVGGGIASLAAAAFLVRNCDFPGKDIHMLEEIPILGGSNDRNGNSELGYVIRGGRMLNDETYENTWDLLMSIPSLDHPGQSVRDEITAFDNAQPTYANARLVNKEGKVEDVLSMGFDLADRLAMVKLIVTPEPKMGILHGHLLGLPLLRSHGDLLPQYRRYRSTGDL